MSLMTSPSSSSSSQDGTVRSSTDVGAGARSSSATGGKRGTSHPFRYSGRKLQRCLDDVNVGVYGKAIPIPTRLGDCLQLYKDYLDHYERYEESRHILRLMLIVKQQRYEEEEEQQQQPDVPTALTTMTFPSSFDRFLETLQLLDNHNNNNANNVNTHRLGINQFADRVFWPFADGDSDSDSKTNIPDWQERLEDFWDDGDSEQEMDGYNGVSSHRNHGLENRRRNLRKSPTQHRLKHRDKDSNHKNMGKKKHHRRHRHRPAYDESDLLLKSAPNHTPLKAFTKVFLPSDGSDVPEPFASPEIPILLQGLEVELHRGTPSIDLKTRADMAREQYISKNMKKNLNSSSKQTQKLRGKDEDETTNPGRHDVYSSGDPEMSSSSFTKLKPDTNTFQKYLDWSTTNNPDGVVLVHPAVDQGTCGSCWALAATGSVEASAARNVARDHYYFGLLDSDNSGKIGVSNVTSTRQLESSTFNNTHLSIQELLDCDKFADQGCTGGNPLLSFFFIHRYGLVPWEEYQYTSGHKGKGLREGYDDMNPTAPQTIVLEPTKFINREDSSGDVNNDNVSGDAGTSPLDVVNDSNSDRMDFIHDSGVCHVDKIHSPIATVESWGLLHKDHEDLIELALKYVGPVAVGMNGGDPSFVHYGGGIYDDTTGQCSQRANHALLITGYGEEKVETFPGYNTTVRYWIARNSWGEGWGEEGYVRIRRGPGGKHIPGVCGIARSPSVALGGQIRHDRTKPLGDKSATSAATRPTQFQLKYSVENNEKDFGINDATRERPFCDSFLTRDTAAYNQCSRLSDAFSVHEAAFVGVVILVFALMVIIPLTLAVIRRRKTEVNVDSLYLDRPNDASADHASYRATETTHLLTLKDMYASIRKSGSGDLANDVNIGVVGGESDKNRSPNRSRRGRSLVMKDTTHDPFRLGDKLWETSQTVNGRPELHASFSSQEYLQQQQQQEQEQENEAHGGSSRLKQY